MSLYIINKWIRTPRVCVCDCVCIYIFCFIPFFSCHYSHSHWAHHCDLLLQLIQLHKIIHMRWMNQRASAPLRCKSTVFRTKLSVWTEFTFIDAIKCSTAILTASLLTFLIIIAYYTWQPLYHFFMRIDIVV